MFSSSAFCLHFLQAQHKYILVFEGNQTLFKWWLLQILFYGSSPYYSMDLVLTIPIRVFSNPNHTLVFYALCLVTSFILRQCLSYFNERGSMRIAEETGTKKKLENFVLLCMQKMMEERLLLVILNHFSATQAFGIYHITTPVFLPFYYLIFGLTMLI